MKKKYFYLLAFLLPFVAMLGICIANGVYPFGKNSFMHCDMYHQYVPFLVEFRRKILSGESLSFVWNLGLGSDFTSVFAYYLATPSNWLVVLCPENLVIEYMTFMILIKIALAGPTFAYYLRYRFQTASPIVLGFSTLYAMSGFVAAYNWNHMWMDTIWLTPLVMLGVEKLVREKKCRLYCLALAGSIFTNYYLSVMMCIFLVLYFGVLLFTSGLHIRQKGGAILRFGGYSLLAGGMTAVLLVPVMYAMRATGFDDSSFPKSLEFYFNALEVITRHFLTIPKHIGLDHWPNIYSGAAVFFLIPMYLLCGRIPLRQRIGKILLAVFMMLSFSTNILNFLWHGFNYPNSLPARQSYLYVFLILTMCFEVVINMKEWKKLWYVIAVGIGGLIMALCGIFVTTEGFTVWVAAITWCFFWAYVVLIVLYFLRPGWQKILPWVGTGILVVECIVNMSVTSVSVVQRTYYATKWSNYEKLLPLARQESGEQELYRFESFCGMTKNDGMLASYPGVSVFSSTTNSHVANLYNKLGMEGGKVSYYTDGTTAFTSALLGVRYTFSEREEDENLYRLVGQSGNMYLYENIYTLPVGFGIDQETVDGLEAVIKKGSGIGLERQRKMAKQLGVKTLFAYLGKNETWKIEKTAHYYAYIAGNPGDTVVLSEILEGKDQDTAQPRTREYDDLKSNCILDLGQLERGSVWEILPTEVKDGEKKKPLKVYLYRLEEKALKTVVERLGEQPLQIEEYKDGYLRGNIQMKQEGVLLLSVPAEEGWTVLVDGVETRVQAWADAFISIPLESGQHVVELRYHPNGWIAGLVVSLGCLTMFILLSRRKKA